MSGEPTQTSFLLRAVRPLGAAPVDIRIEGDRIAEIAADLTPAPDEPVEEGSNALLLPRLVDAHAHLDKTLLGMPWHPHAQDKSLTDMIETERRLRHILDMDPARQSARQVALALSKGTTGIRSHVDIDTEHGLSLLEGVMETQARYRDVMRIEIVAFPQSGLMTRPGTLELMDAAMSAGADLVGGLDPCGIDRDPKGQLDAIFALAERHGKPIDIHLHEAGELGAFSLEMILDRTEALGMQGNVTVSHAFCLGMENETRMNGLLERIAALDVSLATTAPPSRPVPSLRACRDRGILICAGSDGIRDTWTPYGNADMLERAMLVGLRNNLRADVEVGWALEACTDAGARAMGMDATSLGTGARADLVLVDCEAVSEAVAQRPPRKLVVSGGRVVARDGCVEPGLEAA